MQQTCGSDVSDSYAPASATDKKKRSSIASVRSWTQFSKVTELEPPALLLLQQQQQQQSEEAPAPLKLLYCERSRSKAEKHDGESSSTLCNSWRCFPLNAASCIKLKFCSKTFR
ncbi:uncharacterized protein V6R79_007962 [Siganus canaliculatus]